eukprot:scaffold166215_cov86-Attheya_sp.AAC.1
MECTYSSQYQVAYCAKLYVHHLLIGEAAVQLDTACWWYSRLRRTRSTSRYCTISTSVLIVVF